MAVHYSTGYPSADSGRVFFYLHFALQYVHRGFLTYFCLHCNEMPAVEKMGGGFANRGRERGREGGRREGGGFEAFCLHPAPVPKKLSLQKESLGKNYFFSFKKKTLFQSPDDEDWMLFLILFHNEDIWLFFPGCVFYDGKLKSLTITTI